MSLSVKLKTMGKYLDQPALIKNLNKAMPVFLTAAGAGTVCSDTIQAKNGEGNQTFIKSTSTMAFTIASALIATRGLKIKGKEIFEGLMELPHIHSHELEEVLAKATDEKAIRLINKVKSEKVLKLKEIKELTQHFEEKFNDSSLIKKIIPDAHNHGAFEELKNLSVVGLVPVLGGIAGGVTGDLLIKDNWRRKFPDKIKEGSYQYLNNIFLCNVGAGLALVLMNKLKVKSKAARFSAMLAGVVAVGLAAGSMIANFIGKKIINPLFDKTKQKKQKNEAKTLGAKLKELNSERHPEALDLSLHIDDIASVGFLSGFKWIGPILPALYSVSGYRAGTGYRNGKNAEQSTNQNVLKK